MPPWERVVATPDLWPDELIDDITGWFDDLRGRWPDVVWWVRRVHEASVSSRMPLLQQVNYVLIASGDFHAFARNPHGLMELGFRDPQLHTTVLPRLINMPTLRTFLAPLWAGMQTSLTVRASLNGIALAHQLVTCESGFYLRVTWEGSPYLVSQIEHMASSHTLQLHRPPTIFTGATVYIPGGNRLIFSRKITLIGPNSERDIEGALRSRFPDLVHEGLGAIYVPPVLNKNILITDTGLDIVCGPQGELCACYHNGLPLGNAQLEVADLDFISCWLAEDDTLSSASEVRVIGHVTVAINRGWIHVHGLVVSYLRHDMCPTILIHKRWE